MGAVIKALGRAQRWIVFVDGGVLLKYPLWADEIITAVKEPIPIARLPTAGRDRRRRSQRHQALPAYTDLLAARLSSVAAE